MSAAAKRGRLVYLLAQRSDRERWLLAVLVGVVLPLALIYFAALPLREARDEARRAQAEAAALLDWVGDQVRALPVASAAAPAPAAAAEAIGISALEQSLVQAGLRGQVADLSNRDDGGIDLAFDAVPFADLAAWLAATTPDWGYRVAAFRIERDAPGLVRASFELTEAQ